MTTKNESPSITMSPADLSALVASAVTAALAEKKPSYNFADDLIADRKAAIAAIPTSWVVVFRDCVHIESSTRFDAIVMPNAVHPDGRIVRVEGLRTDLAREKEIYSNALAGEDPRFRALAMSKKFGTAIDLSGADLERIELDMTRESYRLGEMDRALQNTVKQTRLMQLLQPVRGLVGMTVAQARRYATIPATFEVISEGHDSPWPLPSQGA